MTTLPSNLPLVPDLAVGRQGGPVASTLAVLALAAAVALGRTDGYRLAAVSISIVLAAWMIYARCASRPIPARPGRRTLTIVSTVVIAVAIGLLFAWRSSASSWRLAISLAIGAVVAVAVYQEPRIDRWRGRWTTWPIILVGSAVFAYALMSPNLQARWHAIDDHEIVEFLGPDGRIPLSRVAAVIGTTEVGHPGEQARFRPAYVSLRVIGAAMFGSSIGTWFAAHMVLLAVTLAFCWRFFARWVGLIPAGLLVMLAMTADYWGDLWCRLGRAEAFAIAGAAISLEGFAMVYRRSAPSGEARASGPWWRTLGRWSLLGVGVILAVGSKENFLFVLPAVWVVAGALLWRRRLGWIGAAWTLALTAYGGLIIWALWTFLARTGLDPYDQPMTAAGRGALALAGLARSLGPLGSWDLATGGAILAVGLAAFAGRRRGLPAARRIVPGLAVVAGLAAIYAFQCVVYLNALPLTWGPIRYNCPGLLARWLMVVAAVVYGLRLLLALGVNRSTLRAARAGLAGGLAILVVVYGYSYFIQAGVANAAATRYWTANLERAIGKLHAEPNRPVVMVSAQVLDYEPILSVRSFLAGARVTNPIFLATVDYHPGTALERRLADDLKDLSLHGGRGFQPLARLPRGVRPLAIGLSCVPPDEFANIGELWPEMAVQAPD